MSDSFADGKPLWVSARHAHAPALTDTVGRRPYGVHHARAVGEPLTRCGLFAVEWRIFWAMPFDPMAPEACPRCAGRTGTDTRDRHGASATAVAT